MTRCGWIAVALCSLTALASIGVMAANPIGMSCGCTRLSDTELLVDCIVDLHDFHYYYYTFSDGQIEMIALENNTVEHTFAVVSVDSFPFTINAWVYADISGTQLEYQQEEQITCCELYAPEIDLSEGGTPIANGGTHSIGGNPVGQMTLDFSVSNAAGAGPLTVASLAAVGLTNCSAFAVITPLPLVVAKGDTSTVRVAFDIDTPGAFALDLSFTNNDLDEAPYAVTVEGNGLTALQALVSQQTMQLLPRGAGHDSTFLDIALPMDEAGGRIFEGTLPLSGVYEVGEIISGAALICDQAMEPQCTLWIHAYLYAVGTESRPETRELVSHWIARFDRKRMAYVIECNTDEMEAGIYDIFLSHPGGLGQTIRVQIVDPSG